VRLKLSGFVNNAHKFTRAELVADLDGEV